MRTQCVEAVQRAAMGLMGRALSGKDLAKVEHNITSHTIQLWRKDRDAFQKLSKQEQLELATENAVKELLHERAKAQQRQELAIKAEAKTEALKDQLTAGANKSRIKAGTTMLSIVDDGSGRSVSAEQAAMSQAGIWMASLQDVFKVGKGTLFNLFLNKEGTDAFIDEAHGKDSGNPQAKQAAQKYKQVMDSILDQLNAKGFNIGKMVNYHLPQALDPTRLLDIKLFKNMSPENVKKARDAFIEYALPRIDRLKYIELDGTLRDDAAMREMLGASFDTVTSSGRLKEGGEFGGDVAMRHRAHRQLFWKDAQAYREINEKYGSGDPFTMIQNQISQLAKDYVLVNQFGPHAYEMMSNKLKEWGRADKAEGLTTDKDIELFRDLIDYYVGGVDPVRDVKLHKHFSDLRAWMTSVYLGSVPIAQLADQATLASAARAHDLPYFQMLKKQIELAFDAKAREQLQEYGFGVESQLNMMQRHGAELMNSLPQALAGTIFKITGANRMTMVERQTFSAFMSAKFGRLAQKYARLDDVPAQERAFYDQFGVTDRDWQIFRRAGTATVAGIDSFLGIKQIDKVTRDMVQDLIKPEVDALMAQYADLVKQMEEKNDKNIGWVGKRAEKLDAYKQKLERWIEAFEETRLERLDKLEQGNIERGGQMAMRIEKAALDMEIAKRIAKERFSSGAESLTEQLKRGAEWYGRRRQEIGQKLGFRLESLRGEKTAYDKMFDREEASLQAKAKELFGPEGAEDGLRVIGKVTQAAKEFDAYRAKMEARIEKYAKKKDGQATVDRAERLTEQAQMEFAAIKQKADAALNELQEKTGARKVDIQEYIAAVKQKKDMAEAEADVAGYLQAAAYEGKLDVALATINMKAHKLGERAFKTGEELGARRAWLEQQMKDMDKRLAQEKRQAGKEISKKAVEYEKRFDAAAKEFDQFAARVDEMIANRELVVQNFESKIGGKINQFADDAIHDAKLKLLSMVDQEAHIAVLQPAMRDQMVLQGQKGTWGGELFNAAVQFKSFPVAVLRRLMIERGKNTDLVGSKWNYYAPLIAFQTATGALALWINDVLNGRDPRRAYTNGKPGDVLKFGMEAWLKGGGAGIISDMMMGVDWNGRDSLQKTVGPGYGAAINALQLARSTVMYAGGQLTGDEYKGNVAKEAVELFKSSIPFQNVWYAKAAVHGLVLNELHELASPGYKDRISNLAAKQYGSGRWFDPYGETRAPNLANIVQ